MKLQNLKTNPKFNYGKTVLAGGLIGCTIGISALTLVNGFMYNHFKPFMSNDDQIRKHKVVSRIYSKKGEERLERYATHNDYKSLYILKYYDEDYKEDKYSFWYADELNDDQINYLKDYFEKDNKYDLEVIKYFLSNNCQQIDSDESGIDSSMQYYISSNDSYGLKFIVNDEYKLDNKLEPVFSSDEKPIVDLMSSIIVCGGTFIGVYEGIREANSNDRKQKTKKR